MKDIWLCLLPALCFISCKTTGDSKRSPGASQPPIEEPLPQPKRSSEPQAENVFIPDETPAEAGSIPVVPDIPSEPIVTGPEQESDVNPVNFQLKFERFPGTIPQYVPIVAGDAEGTWVDSTHFMARLYVGEELRKLGADCIFSHGPVRTTPEKHTLKIPAGSGPGYYRYEIDDIRPDGSSDSLKRLSDGQVTLSCDIAGKTYARSYPYQRYIFQSMQAGAYALKLVRDDKVGVTGFTINLVPSYLQVSSKMEKPDSLIVLTGQAKSDLGANSAVECFVKRKVCADKEWLNFPRQEGTAAWSVGYLLYEPKTLFRVMCYGSLNDEMRFDYSDVMELKGSVPCS